MPKAAASGAELPVDPGALGRLLAKEDCDGDKRITVHDLETARRPGSACAADGTFELVAPDGKAHRFEGTFRLSRLLTELELARRAGRSTIDLAHVEEDPVTAVSRAIRERYWDGLTRRIDADHVSEVLRDPKVPGPHDVVYVPFDDPRAFDYFSDAARRATSGDREGAFIVRRLPAVVTPRWVKDLAEAHGPLTLALRSTPRGTEGTPYVVPGGRFNELYGWDSYFHVLGLLRDGRSELARDIVENFVYEIEHYGRILNANRTYYLTRSQPPFLTSMVRAIADAPGAVHPDRAWLERALRAAVKEYLTWWQGPARRSTLCAAPRAGAPPVCLARYFGEGIGEPPEVEPGHFAWIYKKYAERRGMTVDAYTRAYRHGDLSEPGLDRFFVHDLCMRESGHDTTYRWFDLTLGEDRCADYVTVDLNSLLYKIETDLAEFLRRTPELAISDTPSMNQAAFWCERARTRAMLMRRYLFDADRSLFFDYDVTRGARSTFLAATTFYPLWVSTRADGCDAPIVTQDEARRIAAAALARLEGAGGLFATSEDSSKAFAALPPRQWEYPNGWAPHQMIAWEALDRWGLHADEQRLAYKWLQMIARNAALYAGTVPEKFDVRARSHRVYAEYGNVGTEFQYITDEGFGWMNASFEDGLARLTPAELAALRDLREPDDVVPSPRSPAR
jgi:alpha,alpha-trehalase